MSTVSAGSTRFVQPIAVLRAGCHEDAVKAVALASVLAYVNTGDDPAWGQWLTSRFAKSVRRAKAGQFAALAPGAAAVVQIGEAKAAAFIPSTYEDLDPALSKLQVSGTDFDRSEQWRKAPEEGWPWLLVNEGLGMTTGKTAAQTAHALFVWFLQTDENTRSRWAAEGFPFTVEGVSGDDFVKSAKNARVTINDAGFTEIEPGSATVLVTA